MRKNRHLLRLILFFLALGSRMYGLFVPIYYLNNGVSFSGVIFFLISYCLGGALAGFFSNIIMHKMGVKIFIVLRGIVEPIMVLLIRFYPVFKISS